MSKNFSANQYESAFKPTILNVWQIGKGDIGKAECFGIRPKARKAHTIPFCDTNGRFFDLKRRGATQTAWLRFKGTWDLPRKLPLHLRLLNTTARRPEHAEKNKNDFEGAIRHI